MQIFYPDPARKLNTGTDQTMNLFILSTKQTISTICNNNNNNNNDDDDDDNGNNHHHHYYYYYFI